MDCVTYKKIRNFKYNPSTTNREWFGMESTLCNSSFQLYEDNSFAKHDYLQNVYDRRLNSYTKAYDHSKNKVETFRSHLYYSYITKKQLITIYQRKKKKRELMEESAVKIQKVIRGFLLRKKYQNVVFT